MYRLSNRFQMSALAKLGQGLCFAIVMMIGASAAHATSNDQGYQSAKGKHSGQHWSRGGKRGSWIASWATASSMPSPFDGPTPALNDTTLRQIVRTSLGGPSIRVWFTNEMGSAPMTIAGATVGLRKLDDGVKPGSLRELTFGGESAVTIAAGARIVSDPVRLHVGDRQELAISMYLPDGYTAADSPLTYHVRGLQTSYLAAGAQTELAQLDSPTTIVSWYHLAGVDVLGRKGTMVLAAYGDSISDGDQVSTMEPVDENARYPDFLAKKLLRNNQLAVINLGVSGNQVLTSFIGQNLQARLSRDVLSQSGVTHVIVQGGINDIGLPGLLTFLGNETPANSAAAIIAGLQQIAARIRVAGLVAVGGTLSPSGSVPLPGYTGSEAEAKRQAINAWIRTSGAFDLVVDFDAVLADPADPTVMRADLTADGLHPNSAGYRQMAKAVKRVLRRAGYVH